MGQVLERLTPELTAWIGEQPMFFVATAPLDAAGHVNCSPKGLDTFRVLDPGCVAWLDLTGSGAETIAHLRENGRVVVMFCAFAGPPRILRLHGRGRIVLPDDDEFAALAERFADLPGMRSVVVVDVTRVATSCGFGVPRMELRGARDELPEYTRKKGEDGMREFRATWNASSIDGLPALDRDA